MKNIYTDNNKFQVICEQYKYFSGISIADRIALSYLISNKKLFPSKFKGKLIDQLKQIDKSLINYVIDNKDTVKNINGCCFHTILRHQIDLNNIIGLNKALSFTGWSLRLFIVMVSMIRNQGAFSSISLSIFDNSKNKKNVTKLSNQLKRFCDNNNIKYNYNRGVLTIIPKSAVKVDQCIETVETKQQHIEKVEEMETEQQPVVSEQPTTKQQKTTKRSVFDLGEGRFDRADIINIVNQHGGKEQFIIKCNDYCNSQYKSFCIERDLNSTKLCTQLCPSIRINQQNYFDKPFAIRSEDGKNITRLFIERKGYLNDQYLNQKDEVYMQVYNFQRTLFKQLTDKYDHLYQDKHIESRGKAFIDELWKATIYLTFKVDIILDLALLAF